MVLPFETITQSAEATQTLGEKFGHSLVTKEGSAFRVICLWGELGSGKTTFVQGLARGLGITTRLLSPTFIIVRRYQIPVQKGFLYHLDLYRIQDVEDLPAIGFTEMVHETGSLTVIEWPERLGRLLPDHRIDLRFQVLPNGNHTIICKVL